MSQTHNTTLSLVQSDPYLTPYAGHIEARTHALRAKIAELTLPGRPFVDAALGHLYFGLHREKKHWVLREWAPNLLEMHLVGDFNQWKIEKKFAFKKINPDNWAGNWELKLPLKALKHGDMYRLYMVWAADEGYRVPAWAFRVVQVGDTPVFNAQVWQPETPYVWKHERPAKIASPLVYESHVGMAGEEARVSTYAEFTRRMLPRIVEAGYDTIQLMAIMEHPYYGSFGYHVSNFFAPSSRFGTPDELKELVDTAHGLGLRVVMDVIHSHVVKNENDGLSRYDGSYYQFFHEGKKGDHAAWDSRCFNYAKPEVLHFLLSNLRYWLDTFRFDGFRFDGVTSMLYLDHGLNGGFTDYNAYFNGNQDGDALTYLGLANHLVHEVCPVAVTVAEDVSGMPGLAAPLASGGFGFDYRFAMGVPDFWKKSVTEKPDEAWDMETLFHELTDRRKEERTIGYVESHDQAIVGDKTLAFRLADKAMYDSMGLHQDNLVISRFMALHKMIRLVTLSLCGNGYLNFMGNEFGHPEWIDFPREGNGWSYAYARRQWSLSDNPELKYRFLLLFDRAMVLLIKSRRVLDDPMIEKVTAHTRDKVLVYRRAGLVFAFNFHPTQSFTDYSFNVPSGKYRVLLDSDAPEFGGHNRINRDMDYLSVLEKGKSGNGVLKLYLPSRTAVVLVRILNGNIGLFNIGPLGENDGR